MTTIIYRKTSIGYLCRELISDGKSTEVLISVDGCRDGEICFCGASAKIENGVAKFNTPPEISGIFEPILKCGKKSEALERVELRHGTAYTAPSFEIYAKELGSHIQAYEKELRKTGERLKRLEDAVFESKIF